MIPTLHSQNLTLRAPREGDLDAIAAFFQSNRSATVGGPKSRLDCWRGLCAGLGHWMLRGYGMWHIEETATGISVGSTGFIYNVGWDEPELGWHLYEGFEGRGYAYQAATAARAYGAEHFRLNGVISYIVPSNTRSLKLATRLGASFERDGVVMGIACHVYRHPTVAARQ